MSFSNLLRLLAGSGLLFFAVMPALAQPPRPNLKGEVMVLEFHHMGGHNARWRRSFPSFDRDLQRLWARGYRPVTLRQLTSGNFQLPAGTTPVVLSFDDSLLHQIKFTPAGRLAPDCALAHWIAFSHRHPGFAVRPVFFVNSAYHLAFRQPRFVAAKLRLVIQLGGEIGNHTWLHSNLGRNRKAAEDIGRGQQALEHWLPAGYHMVSFALPYGIFPHPHSLAWRGQWRGAHGRLIRWHYRNVVLVGNGPAPSPYSRRFQAHRIPRIQDYDHVLSHWLSYFHQHPERRFRSDGRRHLVRRFARR